MPRNYVRKTNSIAMTQAYRNLPFWERVYLLTVKQGDCEIFTGSRDACGYGRIHNGEGKLVRLHRAIWERDNGSLGNGEVICHVCDNPACINPAHLFKGTQADNIRDMDNKGRRKTLLGSQRPSAKLKEQQIPDIKNRLQRGETCASIALLYNVSEGLIRHIKKGRMWRHVTDGNS